MIDMKKLSFVQVSKAAGFAIAGAIVVNVVLFFLLKAVGVFNDDIDIQPGQKLGIVPIIFSSTLPLIVGALLFILLDKFTQNGYKIFSIISIILLAVSFINPFVGIPGITLSFGIGLNILHIPPALSLLYFLKKETASV